MDWPDKRRIHQCLLAGFNMKKPLYSPLQKLRKHNVNASQPGNGITRFRTSDRQEESKMVPPRLASLGRTEFRPGMTFGLISSTSTHTFGVILTLSTVKWA